jgi:hypothetical protein
MASCWSPDPSQRIKSICGQYGPNAGGNHEFFRCLKTSVHPVDKSGGVGELTDSQIELCARSERVMKNCGVLRRPLADARMANLRLEARDHAA